MMETLAAGSCEAYRAVVREEAEFVPYFRHATPEQELAKLPLGSRPARRKAGGGIESLRAIPWIFAWSQNRLMLPAWLGAGAALAQVCADGERKLLDDMVANWPFFTAPDICPTWLDDCSKIWDYVPSASNGSPPGTCRAARAESGLAPALRTRANPKRPRGGQAWTGQ